MMDLLTVSDLCISFRQGNALVRAVDHAAFHIRQGELLALVGESGSGKSVTALSLMGLLPASTSVIEQGQALFEGQDLLKMDNDALRKIRGNRISMIFQEPMTALNPVLSIGWQLAEVLKLHRGLHGDALRRECIQLLEQVDISDAERHLEEYPHQLSGGMRQRIMIAMALACQPALIIADEPTTALDVTVQAQIMDLLASLRQRFHTAVLLITHNLALVREQADRVAVMYGGSIVEQATRDTLFATPAHPYTRLLLRSFPGSGQRGQRLMAIDGNVPPLGEILPGCRFAPRCPLADETCRHGRPATTECGPGHWVTCHHHGQTLPMPTAAASPSTQTEHVPLLEVRDLKVWFPVRKGLMRKVVNHVKAVDGVSFSLQKGRTLALVGESGCGKTTVGKALLRLVKANGGHAVLHGKEDLLHVSPTELRRLRRHIQMIFQDPFSSLDPRLMVGETIAEGMEIHGIGGTAADRRKRLTELMNQVGLDESQLSRYPHQFSGGQRQRIGLARALSLNPELIICDECTSALDVSVQAQILNLLKAIQLATGVSYLFITHDLSVVAYLADEILVMYLGHIVERGLTAEIFGAPAHPYTKALLNAAPRMEPESGRKVIRLEGDVPSPLNPPSGCPFHPRCPKATPQCATLPPPEHRLSSTHLCHCWAMS